MPQAPAAIPDIPLLSSRQVKSAILVASNSIAPPAPVVRNGREHKPLSPDLLRDALNVVLRN
jgi:hypothetical protein